MFLNHVKEIRQAQNISQTRLARLVEVADTLSQIERGQRAACRNFGHTTLGVPQDVLFPKEVHTDDKK
jgi:DNA-binding XRE family transcriptional regulator